MKAVWTMARLDLAVWARSPWAVAAAVIPPLAMLVLVKVLTVAVTSQPVALVVEGPFGHQANLLAELIQDDKESYKLQVTTKDRARHLLDQQKVVAVIEVSEGFDEKVAQRRAVLSYTLNNVDIDVADDIRRSIDTSVTDFEAPQFGSTAAAKGGTAPLVVPNPYRVDIVETDLRRTDVPFGTYQVLPVLLLLVITVGVLGGAFLGSRDHERRTMTFLRQTPISRFSFVLGRLLGTLLATFALVVPVVFFLSLNGTIHPPAGHWPPFLAVLAATAVLSSGLGVLLGLVLRRPTTVALAGVTVATYLFFLGGGFTTVAFLPGWLRTLSRAVPTRYAIDGMRQTLFYPDLRGVTTDLVALFAFAGAAVVWSVLALGRSTR
jgi:ABC-type transport system involved in multi-copper enzyme maturation permease subunit